MFNKIRLEDGKIKLVKYIVRYEEVTSDWDPNTNSIKSKVIKKEQQLIDAEQKDEFIKTLIENNKKYIVTEVMLPEEVKEFDGKEFDGTFTQAIRLVNGLKEDEPFPMPRVNPSMLNQNLMQINMIKRELSSMDYMNSKYLDGDYTEQQWEEIKVKRKELRDKIRKLEEIK